MSKDWNLPEGFRRAALPAQLAAGATLSTFITAGIGLSQISNHPDYALTAVVLSVIPGIGGVQSLGRAFRAFAEGLEQPIKQQASSNSESAPASGALKPITP